MRFQTALAEIYYLVVHADGEITDNEVEAATYISRIENFKPRKFLEEVAYFEENEDMQMQEKIQKCISDIELLPEADKVRCMAWMGLIASIDGIVGEREWALISQIYIDALDINAREVFEEQQGLRMTISMLKSRPLS